MNGLLHQARALAQPEAMREAFAARVGACMGEAEGQRVRDLEELVARLAHEINPEDQAQKLHRLLFGPKTEKTRTLFPPQDDPGSDTQPEKLRAPGHGRRKSEEYHGSRVICAAHPELKAGQTCPQCGKGTLLKLKPAQAIHIKANRPIEAIRCEMERLRCGGCGTIMTASLPPGVPNTKYDDNVGVMLGLLRFGYGVPHYRLARMQEMLGVPMPESTQWELMAQAGAAMKCVYEALARQAAQACLFHIDDTTMRVQELKKKGVVENPEGQKKKDRTRKGIFTSVIQAFGTGWQVGLYFTGNRYAAERMDELMVHRAQGLPVPIQMSDALSWNGARDYPFVEALCIVHARREFVDVIHSFPDASRRVVEDLRVVYKVEAEAREGQLSSGARLALHQEKSGPVMAELKTWMEQQVAEKRVEPNSGLGGAVKYMLKYWEGLTLFLRQAGAPLDNSIAERAIKRAVLHRKNSLSYMTEKGAQLGDLFMSLIETCRINGINLYDYLSALVANAKDVARAPDQWLPWNYPRAPMEAAA